MSDAYVPDVSELEAFELWLRDVQHVDPAVAYPGINMSYVYDLHRPAYARAILLDAMKSPLVMDEAWAMKRATDICPELDVQAIYAEAYNGQ